jgi:UDP-N-acetylmuramate dehydrogenase
VSAVEIVEDVDLAAKTTLGVGGPARYFTEARNEAAIVEALRWARRLGVSVCVLGGGSNVVVSDGGYDGLVLRVASLGIEHEQHGRSVELTAAAGEPWDALVALCVERGWAGFECLSGIPGLVGATPIQNVGAYGQEVSETIRSVRVYDKLVGRTLELPAADCRFGYRDSLFKSCEPERYVVLAVSYRLLAGAAPKLAYPELVREVEASSRATTLAEVRSAVLRVRGRKSMLLDPADENRRSCGSFFMNPVVEAAVAEHISTLHASEDLPRFPQADGRIKLSAAWLIERAGFRRGERAGPVGLSSRHTLALVCHEGARAGDVVSFARRIRSRVAERFGVELVPEPNFWGFASLEHGLPDERLA